MHRNIRSPLLSMNVTSSRFTTHFPLSATWRSLFQFAFSSLTHGPTRRPCSTHLSSFAVLVIVIFNISSGSLVSGHCKRKARGPEQAPSNVKAFNWLSQQTIFLKLQRRRQPWTLHNCRKRSTVVGTSVGAADSLPSSRPAVMRSSSVFNHLACILFDRVVGEPVATFHRV